MLHHYLAYFLETIESHDVSYRLVIVGKIGTSEDFGSVLQYEKEMQNILMKV